MNIKLKALKIIRDWGCCAGDTEVVIDKIDLLYRKEMEKEIKGMKDNPKFRAEYAKRERWELVRANYFLAGFNRALQDVLDLLSHKKETK